MKSTVHQVLAVISNYEEALHEQESQILGEWIKRYCDDSEGKLIRCYTEARDAAVENGETILVEQYDKIQELLKFI